MLAWIKKWQPRTEITMVYVSAILIFVMAVWTTVSILGRHLFNSPLMGTFELVQLLMGGVVFFSFAYVQYTEGHITVPIIRQRLSGRGAALLDIAFLMLMLAVSVMIAWYGGRNAIVSCQRGDTTIGIVAWPVGPAKMVVPIGFGLLSLRLLSQICGAIIAEFSRHNTSVKGRQWNQHL